MRVPLEARRGWAEDNTGATDNVALILSHNIRHALLDLPNGAVTGEDVDPRTGEKDGDALTVTCANGATDYAFDCTITMNSKHNSGDLSNKLECWAKGCTHVGVDSSANPGGCSPKYMGLPVGACSTTTSTACWTTADCPASETCSNASTCTVTDTAGTSNYDTCSGRGACNGADGLCECFEGFTDEDCHVQTVLV